MNDTHKYDEIIGMEHPSSKRHPRMSMKERAAQFAPFAALNLADQPADGTEAESGAD